MSLEAVGDWYTQWNTALGWEGAAVVRLALAALLGLLIGFEREHNGSEAGLRTHALVCVGSAMTMIVSLAFARLDWWDQTLAAEAVRLDPARVAYGVMGGIGFLGAGAIIRSGGNVRGLTTAAGIWCAAAIGLGAGQGLLVAPVAATLIVLALLYGLELVAQRLPRERVALATLSLPRQADTLDQLRRRLKTEQVEVRRIDIDAAGKDRLRVTAMMACPDPDLQGRVVRVCDAQPDWHLRRFKWIAD